MEQVTLPIEEQQLLLCAHEECELWQVLSGIGEVMKPPIHYRDQLEMARRVLLKYLSKGWVSIADARDRSGRWNPKPISTASARELVATDRNWATPTGLRTPEDETRVVVLTAAGEKALEAGAAAEAFARIRPGPS